MKQKIPQGTIKRIKDQYKEINIKKVTVWAYYIMRNQKHYFGNFHRKQNKAGTKKHILIHTAKKTYLFERAQQMHLKE